MRKLDPELKHKDFVPYLQPGKTLDIGYIGLPNRTTPTLYGIDIVAKPEGSELGNYAETKVIDLNVEPIPYPAEFFDNVLAGDIIEHVANPLALLGEANRVLKQGGTLIVSTPNPYYYWELIQNMLVNYSWMRARQEEHFTSFTRINMRTILSRMGFQLIAERGVFFTLIVLKWQFHLKRWPFLAFQISYVAKKVAAPSEFIINNNYDGTAHTAATRLGFVESR
jgi:SAM-dependent methyltransferase